MNYLPWIGFAAFVIAMLALDLGVFQRKSHIVTVRESLAWFGVWFGLAMIFNIGVVSFHERGAVAGLEFFTGYLVEKSLSIDNIFVFILIFNFFNVPPVYQHKVLFWGIFGAILLRVVFIVGGLALLDSFHWMIYVFGVLLLATGFGMIRKEETTYDPEKNWIIRNFRKVFRSTDRVEGNRFFLRVDGRLCATPLFIVLLVIESSDIIFAVDSIPAIFAISDDAFIVFTSNIFAMLGLRSLYFAVSGVMQMFHFLHYGFASIIMILGVKMLLSDVYKVPIGISLMAIVLILMLCVILSLLRPRMADLKSHFERTEKLGLIPFRRLLLIENIVDLSDLKVRDVMCKRTDTSVIKLDVPWSETVQMIRATRFSRYPIVEPDGEKVAGIFHIKNFPFADPLDEMSPDRLKRHSRSGLQMNEDIPLEEALAQFQRHYDRLALVIAEDGKWSGILTFEDVLGQIVGSMGDEFDLGRKGPLLSLADAMSPRQITLDLHADTMKEAIRKSVATIMPDELPVAPELIARVVLQREEIMASYMGNGLAIPHCRIAGITKPLIAFARSNAGIAIKDSTERADLIFLLLTPSRMARIEPQLLASIEGLFNSEYVTDRLRKAMTPQEVIEAIRAGQEVGTDQRVQVGNPVLVQE